MKQFLFLLFLGLSVLAAGQANLTPEQIRARMAEIRRTTNWDDAAAAEKANAEIKNLAVKLMGGNPSQVKGNTPVSPAPPGKTGSVTLRANETNKENVTAIARRFFERSYKILDLPSKSKFDFDFRMAEKEKFNLASVRRLSNMGVAFITFGNDHHIACVYLASAVNANPTDTLVINNFGAYLRIIDSVRTSLPVLLYANQLFGESPVILTQIGCSYLELKDDAKGEKYLKEALVVDPEFGQAHSALCELYLKQKRWEDAILELFAGVKGMGAGYRQTTNNFRQIQAQQQKQGSSKEALWDETKKQLNPAEVLAPLVPEEDRVKMPEFKIPASVDAWQLGGGYMSAVSAYSEFHSYFLSFVSQVGEVHRAYPPHANNSLMRDYPDSRFALECITEMFYRESEQKAEAYQKKVDELTESVDKAKKGYLEQYEIYARQFKSCAEGCPECMEECLRQFCAKECPNANEFNEFLQSRYDTWSTTYQEYVDDQEKTLNDLYGFSAPWLAKIESPYWHLVYAFEVKRVALSIVGKSYMYYPQLFQLLAQNQCGSECSAFAASYAMEALNPEVNRKNPEKKICPENAKFKLGLGTCDAGLDCESVEFGCTEGIAFNIKRNFIKDNTTLFVGVGVSAEAGVASASAKTGVFVTVNDNKEVTDYGTETEVAGSVGVGKVKAGASLSGGYSVMKGLNGNYTAEAGISVY